MSKLSIKKKHLVFPSLVTPEIQGLYDHYTIKKYLYYNVRILFLPFQPAHVKACFLGSNLTVPVSDGKLNLGTWQGVWLCEHRDRAGSRKILVTVNGALRDPDRTPLSPNSPIASTSS